MFVFVCRPNQLDKRPLFDLESYREEHNQRAEELRKKLQEEDQVIGCSNISPVYTSEWTIRLSSRRSSMKMMVGVYRSRFQTIDYFMISQDNFEYPIFRSFYIK